MRILLGLVMMASFIGKGIDIETFEVEIKTILLPFFGISQTSLAEKATAFNRILPILPIVARFILGSELLIGIMMITDYKTKFAAAYLIILLMMFSVALIMNILYPSSEPKSCGCFGALWEEPVTWWSVGRNVVLAGLSWLVYQTEARKEG